MADNIIVLTTYPNPLDAHLARTRLEAAGIPCFLSNEALVTLNVMYSPAAGGVRLHVYARDAERAAEVLHGLPYMYANIGGLASNPDETPRDSGAGLTCPRCGSSDVGSDVAVTASWWARLRAELRRQLGNELTHHCYSCGLNF